MASAAMPNSAFSACATKTDCMSGGGARPRTPAAGRAAPRAVSGATGGAALHVADRLDDLELRALAGGEIHVLVDLAAVHRDPARGAVERQAFGSGGKLLRVGA